ncbi:hypothetical protein NLG97_g3591 [Lecanicillium saksenae]|uniref:Uncharacterized protein n=1 Tax=Lecanicillium saksenae TaxID=468837 RepID=A0ACC1QZ26_9HYPO|nr:hypothetical protein NLG97_g3591 [Lecanicillium saksenae]
MSAMEPEAPVAAPPVTAATTVAATTNLGSMPSMDLSGDCTIALYKDGSAEYAPNGKDLIARLLRDKLVPHTPKECLPSPYWSAAASDHTPVYSPGSACPAGYTPACTSVATGAIVPAAESVQFWSPLASGEVAIGCCPSGFACGSLSYGYGCGSTLKSGEAIVAALSTNGSIEFPVQMAATSSLTIVVSAVKLVYITSQAATSTPPSTTTPTPTSTSAPAKPTTGLSAGQKAAIGVCIPLFAIAIAVALFFFCRRRRRGETAKEGPMEETMTEGKVSPTTDVYGKHELDGGPTRESRVIGQEASSSPAPFEMPGSEVGMVGQNEIVELPAHDRSASPSSTGRQSPIIRRKPVTASPLSEGEPFGHPDPETEDR